jgi:hypothetical protein
VRKESKGGLRRGEGGEEEIEESEEGEGREKRKGGGIYLPARVPPWKSHLQQFR